VLLAALSQACAMSSSAGDTSNEVSYETSVALLQTTVLHQAARSFAGRHALGSSVDQTMQLIYLLDVDNDGRVSREEVNRFAAANGLDPNSIAAEFAGVDTNGNGILEQDEITSLLSSSPEEDTSVGGSSASAMNLASQDNSASSIAQPEELSEKVPLLTPAAALLRAEATPKHMEKPQLDKVDELFAQVPLTTSQAIKSAQTSGDEHRVSDGADTISHMQYREAAGSSAEGSSSYQGEQESGSPAAISATQKMAEQINSELDAGARSMTFQAAASTLRANASAILLHAQLEARAAAQKTATEVTMKTLKQINKLQSRASKAEMRAAALRARANYEMKEAYAAVAVASGSMAKITKPGEKASAPPQPAEPAQQAQPAQPAQPAAKPAAK